MKALKDCLVAVSFACAVGCERETPQTAPETATPTPSVAPSAAAPKQPPHVGTWKGSAELQPHRVGLDPKQGGVKQWQDAGAGATGRTELTVVIDADGNATGELSGAAGSLRASGRFHEDSLRLQLTDTKQQEHGFAGLFVGTLKGDSIAGSLRISSGDSLRVRVADVTLRK